MSIRKTHPIVSIVNNSLYNLPAPSNITNIWNFGSILGACLMLQTVTGIFLAIHYRSRVLLAFDCISHIIRDTLFGWLTRLIHANGASLFFILIFTHIGRGLYYNSFQIKVTWSAGVFIFLISILVAFLGYVLPWGQISFWGATVITNLVSAVPYVGTRIVEWVWGGFSVNNATLRRFFSLHFTLPFVVIFLVVLHLVFLHEEKSRNPLGLRNSADKIFFYPYFSRKDLISLTLVSFFFLFINLQYPFMLIDPDNFTPANPIITPVHIQPEWYFLFAYAILRAIPNKLGGVVCLILSILILLIRNLQNIKIQISKIRFKAQTFWYFVVIFLILTWFGMKPVEEPFVSLRILFTFLYFSWFLI